VFFHFGLGGKREALACLRRAFEERDALLPWIKRLPDFDHPHSNPEFLQILRTM
jgi:hypothetical protein